VFGGQTAKEGYQKEREEKSTKRKQLDLRDTSKSSRNHS